MAKDITADIISQVTHKHAEKNYDTVIDEDLNDMTKTSVIATGFDSSLFLDKSNDNSIIVISFKK